MNAGLDSPAWRDNLIKWFKHSGPLPYFDTSDAAVDQLVDVKRKNKNEIIDRLDHIPEMLTLSFDAINDAFLRVQPSTARK